ncbi:outer membrane lipoprotein chaperone LolA [Pseudothauera nasutitermitis]|uniref:Outer-membrane lipoprotein carrier protein n=1 Tax=Pseudothauera nasutitermitis TaxID=2565930 RepID=A0A4S4B027_9RHOO|nr:outer membrane lipoprotein chaperone LolA [Pseudothauera nasutitermitis]THF65813.1 outer membrane lipoprotein chaperone LolA [Pseudothauera nasutitermitis]
MNLPRRFALLRLAACAALVLAPALHAPAALAADGIEQLRRFVADTRQAQGSFTQIVHSASGRKPQEAAGEFAFSRPGRFRWSYDTPYQQLLVGDGERLWSWDRDLAQVTVRALGDALGSTPAAVLVGAGDLDDAFELSDGGAADGLSWVVARPRQADSGFESMRLGLAGNRLQRMEMRDSFGQNTVIVFTRLETAARLDDTLFQFTPPPGADVIGQ